MESLTAVCPRRACPSQGGPVYRIAGAVRTLPARECAGANAASDPRRAYRTARWWSWTASRTCSRTLSSRTDRVFKEPVCQRGGYLSRGGPVRPEAGLSFLRRACLSQGGLVYLMAGLSVELLERSGRSQRGSVRITVVTRRARSMPTSLALARRARNLLPFASLSLAARHAHTVQGLVKIKDTHRPRTLR